MASFNQSRRGGREKREEYQKQRERKKKNQNRQQKLTETKQSQRHYRTGTRRKQVEKKKAVCGKTKAEKGLKTAVYHHLK